MGLSGSDKIYRKKRAWFAELEKGNFSNLLREVGSMEGWSELDPISDFFTILLLLPKDGCSSFNRWKWGDRGDRF